MAGLIFRCGLLQPQLAALQEYALRMFKTPGNEDVLREFTDAFSRRVEVEFLGLWDTVTSMGNVWSPTHWPYTAQNPIVRRVAHAMAIDERRAFFRPNRWTSIPKQDVAQVWFAGVHSDIGGGYPASTGRLWAITLEWMVGRARSTGHAGGLALDQTRYETVLAAGTLVPSALPEALSDQHDSLTKGWKPLELVPKRARERNADGTYERARWMVPAFHAGLRGRPRVLSPGEHVHRSAIERFAGRSDYRPDTLRLAGLTEAEARTFLAGTGDVWTVPTRQ